MQPETETNPSQNPSNPQILIVEDSPLQALQLRRLLEQQGYTTGVARNGREALELLQTARPVLIISDINMPEMDGYTMCAALKQDAGLKPIPVILLTSLADTKDLIRGLEAQADSYLTKPYNEPILLTRIQQLLDSRHEETPEDAAAAIEVLLDGHAYVVTSNRRHMMTLLLSTYENAVQQNRELTQIQHELERTNQQLRAQTEKLQQAYANHRALLQSNADAMIVVDRTGNVRFTNPAAQAMFGPEDQQFLSDLLKYSQAVGETIEIDINRPGRQPIVTELRIVETLWEGEPASLATLRDVTARKRLERQIAELEARLKM